MYKVPCPAQYLKDVAETDEDRDEAYEKILRSIENFRILKSKVLHISTKLEFVEYFSNLFKSQGWDVLSSSRHMVLIPKESSNA